MTVKWHDELISTCRVEPLAALVVDLQQTRYRGAIDVQSLRGYTGYTEEHPAHGARSEVDVSSHGRTDDPSCCINMEVGR